MIINKLKINIFNRMQQFFKIGSIISTYCMNEIIVIEKIIKKEQNKGNIVI